MKKYRLIPLLLSGCLFFSACGNENAEPAAQAAAVSDEGYIDTLTPKNDFYGYINAKELMETDLDGESITGTLYALDKEELCVCDISALLGMTISAVSHQLKILRDSNLVKTRRNGKVVYYSLADEHVQKVIECGVEHIMEKR